MGFIEELKAKNFSIYAQWAGLISIVLLIIFGVIAFTSNPIFCILAWVIAFILVFVEVPILTKVCPTSPTFDQFVKKFENNNIRATGYIVFSTIMWISLVVSTTSLIVPAITLFFAGLFYGIASVKHQQHAASVLTGGGGVDGDKGYTLGSSNSNVPAKSSGDRSNNVVNSGNSYGGGTVGDTLEGNTVGSARSEAALAAEKRAQQAQNRGVQKGGGKLSKQLEEQQKSAHNQPEPQIHTNNLEWRVD
ncbi:hypothetical protein G9A89_014999 [Geosiphon pyriformis]|nr:hypothetical protein G9A89_014999 [Geosiphon pyriformis]